MILIATWLKFLLLNLIKIYQKTLSLDHGYLSKLFPFGYCKFQPTCSEYAYQAINKYGIIKGSWLSMKRILRCNPLNRGGNDPVK